MIYPVTILFTLAFVFYTKYQFEDVKAGWGEAKGKWHPYGLTMRLLPFGSCFWAYTLQDVVLCVAINSIIFDVGINKIAMGKDWFYIGQTAKTDKIFGKMKWYAMGAFLVAAIVVKIVT